MKNIATMKKQMIKLMAIVLFCLGLSVGIVNSESAGPVDGRSGVPAGGGFPEELTCNSSECHGMAGGFPLNPDTRGKIELLNLPDNYIPGQHYRLTFRTSHPDADRRRWGFQLTAVTADTFLPAGDFVVLTTGVPLASRIQRKVGGPGGDRKYVEHFSLSTNANRTGGNSWIFEWVAPETNVGDVNFYGAGNAANNNSLETGDKIFTHSPDPLAVAKGQFVFTNIAAAANVATGSGQGAAVGDFDNDSHADIFVARAGQNLLYRNNGDGTFAEVAAMAGIGAADADSRSAAWGDYNGDGYLDLYVVNAGPDALYRNNGDGTFINVSAEAGISDEASGHAVAWGDFNGDTHLDLYAANEGQDALYLNNGNGTFTKADPAATGTAEQAASWSVAVADFNGDNRPDIFVANDGQAALYRNNGDGTFTDVAAAAGLQTASAQSRAAAWADYDGDGDQDLFIANVGQDLLYRNNGNGTFADVTMAAGLVDTPVGAAAGAAWTDYDKDGDQDLVVVNEGQDFLYRNNGNGTFNQVATFSGLTDAASGRAAAWIDVDNDANPDLFIVNAVEDNFLYRNPGRSGPAPAGPASGVMRGGEYLMAIGLRLLKIVAPGVPLS
jgi:glycosyltransferase A (GT-A) superfamily protein (DUF2064 family)